MQKTSTDPDKFIDSLPADIKDAIAAIDKVITNAIPKEKRVMWEGIFYAGNELKIIGYGDFVFINSKKQEVPWFVAGLAPQKNYITIYLSGSVDGQSLTKKFGKELGKPSKIGSGTVSFKKLEDVNLEKLAEVAKLAAKSRDEVYESRKKL